MTKTVNNHQINIYLQKYLIQTICNHINKKNEKNKLYSLDDIKKDFNVKETKFILTLALVCKSWFNCLSNNLVVSKDFHGLAFNEKETEYSILKKDNILTLKLIQYENDDDFQFRLKNKINQLKNLERIVVCRYFSQKELIRTEQTFNLDFLNKVFKSSPMSPPTSHQQSQSPTLPNNINQSIKIDLHISLYCNIFGFPNIPYATNCQFKVNKLKIDSCCDDQSSFSIMDYIKYFNPNKLSIVPSPSHHSHSNQDPHFKYKKLVDYTPGSNVFSFLEQLSISKVSLQDVLSIKEIYYILKSLPNLQSLSFQMCQNSMIHKFTENELSKQRPLFSWEKPDFYFYFERVRDMLINHKNLFSLSIGTGCKNKCCKELKQSNTETSKFAETFSQMISSNNSIKSLSLLNFNNNREIIDNISAFKNIPIKTIK
ncbi:hypothetical protein RB653_000380 [Dictyostelium firmibasis]|uniref:F-box domain-containing protein n=1 Tax=Dictyostelium firmibasis TaxID=79012 RepID=A0AAN7TV55_9MYCE